MAIYHLLIALAVSWGVLADDQLGSAVMDPNAVLGKLHSADPCDTQGPSTRVSCSELSDQFCRELYLPQHRGNLERGATRFSLGKSKTGAIAMTKRLDLEALADSGGQLPSDLQRALEPRLKSLKILLSQEANDRAWLKKLAETERAIQDDLSEVALERVFRAHPDQKARDLSDRETFEDQARVAQALQDAQNELVRAKYARHPRWQTVEALFKEAKADLRKVIEEEKDLEPSVRKEMLSALDGVELILPYDDPRMRGGSASKGCSSTKNQATYFPLAKRITVCAGLFNGQVSIGSLYQAIAHELSHSFDTEALAMARFGSSSLGIAIQRLCSPKKNAFTCDEWSKLKANWIQPAPSLQGTEGGPAPYPALNACLVDRSDLKEWTLPSLKRAAANTVSAHLGQLANQRHLTMLGQPTRVAEDGSTVPNKFYLRPDLFRSSVEKHLVANTGACRLDAIPGVFVQELVCQGYETTPLSKRTEVFASAIKSTEEFLIGAYLRNAAYCGRDCEWLDGTSLGRMASEPEADWWANRALELRIKRDASINQRRQLAVEAGADFCQASGVFAQAEDLREVEAQIASDVHPDDRPRRLAVFTPEVARLLGCRADPEALAGIAGCSLKPKGGR